MSSKKILEIACFNLPSALIAQSAGADRIELCENYSEGGLTPSYTLIKEVGEKVNLPVHVIIRPHGAGFIYSETELNKMVEDILFCKQQKINGVVIGVLTKNNEVDVLVCQRLLKAAKPMPVAFHRAIDACADLHSGFKSLIALGVDRVLTSGGKGNVAGNINKLQEVQKEFGNKIMIMPGGGVRSSNILEIMQSGCAEFHSSAITGEKEMADHYEISLLKQFLENPA